MRDNKLFILAPLLAAVLAAGCINPAMFKKGAYAVDDWESWTGWNDTHGSNQAANDGLQAVGSAANKALDTVKGGAEK